MAAAVCLLTAATATAGPLDPLKTMGEWSDLGPASNTGPRWFDNVSWDGPEQAVAWGHQEPGWKYLHKKDKQNEPEGFGWEGALPASWTTGIGQTDWTGGVLTHDPVGGAFHYDSGTGRHSNSYGAVQMLLLMRETSLETVLELWVEDILWGDVLGREDRDYNDAWGRMGFAIMPPVQPPVTPPETPVIPEPGTMALFGTGLLAIGRRLRRRYA
jgi:hypothetical protein